MLKREWGFKTLGLLVLTLALLTTLACGLTSSPTPTPIPTPVPTDIVFKVDAGKESEFSFNMREGSTFNYSFKSDLDINASIVDPRGNMRASWDRVYQHEGSYIADTPGIHRMVFDNSFSLFTGKNVALRYQVVHR